LRQTGEIADGCLPTHWPRARLADGIAEIRAGAESSKRDPSQIEIAPFVNVVISDDLKRARNQARLPLAYYVGGMGDYYHDSISRLGFADEADKIRNLWQAGRRKSAIAAVTDEMVDAIAICGSVERCRTLLDEMGIYGATLPLIPIPTEGSASEKCRAIEALIT
jgi:alkanesulfonate monooxygenase SsuD/methylene tetrahydromethanopterin reductase-like flavin-dependent oxidoreductase (luciferase family)